MADKAQPTDAAAPSPAVTDETQPAPPTTPPRRSPGHRGQDMRDTVAEMAAKAHEISLEAGSKMAGAMKDVINAAAGLAGFAVESARDLVQYMVRRGQMTQDEADKLIREAEEAYNKRHPQARGGAAAASAESNGATRTRETKSAAPHVATHGAVHAAPAAPAVKKAAEPARPAATKAAEPARPAATKAAAPTKAAAKPATKSAAKAPAKAATKAPATKSAAKAPAAKGGAKSASKTAAKKAPAKKK